MQSVVTGQGPLTLERKITSGGKRILRRKTEDIHTIECLRKPKFTTKVDYLFPRYRRLIIYPNQIWVNMGRLLIFGKQKIVEPNMRDRRFDRCILFAENSPDALDWPSLPRE